jgi:16S rRNA (uracil1498-N3)-methyltransferase
MPAERYYIEDDFEEGDQKALLGPEFHHLVHVMRTKVGEEVELVNGKGLLAQSIVEKITKDRALLKILDLSFLSPSKATIILAQAMPKPNRLDFILEKGTELGVDEFWLFPGNQSAKKEVFPSQEQRMKGLTVAAMKQCGRLFLPEIKFMPPLDKWELLQGSAFFGDVEPSAHSFESVWRDSNPTFPMLFFVGPESGFSDAEVTELKRIGAQGVKLHPNILRTDTAAITALSLIGHWLME